MRFISAFRNLSLTLLVAGTLGLLITGATATTASAAALVQAGAATIADGTASAPASCALEDSWCAYCQNHPSSDLCAAIPPSSPPSGSTPVLPPAPAPLAGGGGGGGGGSGPAQAITSPGGAIIEAVYQAAVAAVQSARIGVRGGSWVWCTEPGGGGRWLEWTSLNARPC